MKPRRDILLNLCFLLCCFMLFPSCNEEGGHESGLPDDQDTDLSDEPVEGDEDMSEDEEFPGDVDEEPLSDQDEENDPVEFVEESEEENDEMDPPEEEPEYDEEPDESEEVETESPSGICDDLSSPDGLAICLERITSLEDWLSMTLDIQDGTQIRGTKYFLPADNEARLPPLVMNINTVLWHYEMLAEVFGSLFPDLMLEDYNLMVYAGEDREFLAGTLTEHLTTDLKTHYVFTIWDDPSHADWVLTCNQLHDAYTMLTLLFTLGPIEFQSYTPYQATMLINCSGVPIFTL